MPTYFAASLAASLQQVAIDSGGSEGEQLHAIASAAESLVERHKQGITHDERQRVAHVLQTAIDSLFE